MPAALERKLKKEAADKGLSKKRKDAYVYGTLRKTGWKPDRDKKMNNPSESINFGAYGDLLSRLKGNFAEIGEATKQGWKEAKVADVNHPLFRDKFPISPKTTWGSKTPVADMKYSMNPSKLVQLSELRKSIDSVIRFAYDDEDTNTKPFLGGAATGGALVGAGVGGTLAHQAIRSSGGYGANWGQAKQAFKTGRDVLGEATGNVPKFGNVVGGLAGGTGKLVGSALSRLKTLLPGVKGLSSNEALIQLDEKILEPFSDGAVPKSKIIQEEFPAGLGAAQVLKFPFPKLMRYLNRPAQLQQQFKGFSKREKLVELQSKIDGLLKS